MLAHKCVAPEFIQDLNPKVMAEGARDLLKNSGRSGQMKMEFQKVRETLGGKGTSEKTARVILSALTEPSLLKV